MCRGGGRASHSWQAGNHIETGEFQLLFLGAGGTRWTLEQVDLSGDGLICWWTPV